MSAAAVLQMAQCACGCGQELNQREKDDAPLDTAKIQGAIRAELITALDPLGFHFYTPPTVMIDRANGQVICIVNCTRRLGAL